MQAHSYSTCKLSVNALELAEEREGKGKENSRHGGARNYTTVLQTRKILAKMLVKHTDSDKSSRAVSQMHPAPQSAMGKQCVCVCV